MSTRTKEPQYDSCITIQETQGVATLGFKINQVWQEDPRRLLFFLARYKFVSKMLSGCSKVLEIGCADGFGGRVVLQEVNSLVGVDFDPLFIQEANKHTSEQWPMDCRVHDMLEGPVDAGTFDGAYSLDVIEHIACSDEDLFLKNILASLSEHGTLIIGSPSIQSQPYASPQSKAGHINCKDAKQLKALMSKYFHNVYIFSMNDEVVHTGFYPMAHYLFALCCNKK